MSKPIALARRRSVNTSATVQAAASQKKAWNADKKSMHAKHADNSRLNDLSGRVIGCAFTVLNTLGAGFLEKVYENALA